MSRNQTEFATKSSEILIVGDHVFDKFRKELRTTDGTLVPLRIQSTDVLSMLAQTPNEVISKDNFVESIWKNTFVTDDSLVQCIGDIRRALGESDRHYIETVPHKGYRLNSSTEAPTASAIPNSRYAIYGSLVLILMVVGSFGVWWFEPAKHSLISSNQPPQSKLGMEIKKPSIAVLPFANMNDDPKQLYFIDGLVEDLIIDLSRVSGANVISSASSFAYRGTNLKIQDIARELGVNYLLLGTVRKEKKKMRITANLIDVASRTNLWAGRYDRKLINLLELQDEVTKSIVSALSIKLTPNEDQLFANRRPVNPDAYDLLLRGLQPFRTFTASGNIEARRYFEKAIALEPDYARAYANLALSYGREIVFRFGENRPDLITLGLEKAEIAEKLDRSIPQIQFARAVLNLAARKHSEAISASLRAIELNSNYADGFAVLAQTSAFGDNLEEGLVAIRRAKQLNPRYPFSYLWVEGHILYLLKQYDKALPLLEEVIRRNPTFYIGLLTLSATYGQLELLEKVKWNNGEILTLKPDFSARVEGAELPYKQDIDRAHFIKGMLKAGLPN
jgi:adenylate cyclase